MSDNIVTILVFILFFSIIVHAQEEISQEKKQRREKGEQESTAPQDTSDLIPVESKLYWYDIYNNLSIKTDSSNYEIHRLADEKKLIYTDMSDIFRSQPLWFDFDLIEAGRPAYISLINTYPHQTPLFFGGALMNDQLQGVYNTQFIPLNYIQFAEVDYAAGSLQNYALWSGSKISITPHSVQTQRPWTKIVYKQGGYGYSDVDIHFEIPFSSTFAVQLGGKNSGFDGAIQSSGYDGQNYRAEITWQFSPQWYFRGQIFLNRIKVGLASLDQDQEFAVPATRENRDDYFLDVTWIQDDSLRQRLHILFYYSNYSRKFKDNFTTYTFETFSERFGFDANYNFVMGRSELLIGASTMLPKIYGDPFKKEVTIPALNTYGKLNIPLSEFLTFRAALQLSFVKDYDLQILPALGTDLIFSKNQYFSFDLTNGERLPNVTERFFDIDTLYGNQNLKPETYSTIGGRYYYLEKDEWHLKIDAGYHRIENEIVWKDSTFSNRRDSRDFIFCGLEGYLKVWWLDFTLAGQYTFADVNLTPKSSVWGQAHFNWVLLNGALIFDAFGTFTWYDKHQDIKYQPRIDRYYTGLGETDAFVTLSWKLVATIQSARIFLEMDNALEEYYEIVSGYPDFYRRLRLGVNWTLWD
ncbi:MAG: TonB-dependent receptor [Calditrichia bacterium]|nr:TonB-dependent receptor [Calditrichia bacterium]